MSEFIDMTPTPEGFRNIAMHFADSILRDVKVARREDSRAILDSLVDIVCYLSRTNVALVAELRSYIKGDDHDPLCRDHGHEGEC